MNQVTEQQLQEALRVVVEYAKQQYIADMGEDLGGEELSDMDYLAIHQTACHMLADKVAEQMPPSPAINTLYKD